jgi:hypothetical protein
MKKYLTRLLVGLALCLPGAPTPMRADVPLRLVRIQSALPCGVPQQGGTFLCPQLTSDHQLVVERNAAGEVTHLGVSIFSTEFKAYYNVAVCNCVERSFLELLETGTTSERQIWLRQYGVRLLYNGYPFGTPQFTDLSRGMKLINEQARLDLSEEDNCYQFTVTSPSDDALSLCVPKDREYIFATDKKEEDEVVDRLLQNGKHYTLTPLTPQTSQLRSLRPNLWVWPGQSYMIDSLSTEKYYVRAGEQWTPLYAAETPCESMRNLLLGQVSGRDIRLDVTHKMYGLSHPQFLISLSDFLGILAQQDCRMYATARLVEGGQAVSGLLLIENVRYNYIHLVTVTAPVADLFVEHPLLRTYLYTNVPQHNVLNLFFDKSN